MQEPKVTFESKSNEQLEHCHNLIAQTVPEDSNEHEALEAMLMARSIKITKQGASFVQHHLLNEGTKAFGKRGADASMKETINHPPKLLCSNVDL
jgi:hypothetical protein